MQVVIFVIYPPVAVGLINRNKTSDLYHARRSKPEHLKRNYRTAQLASLPLRLELKIKHSLVDTESTL